MPKVPQHRRGEEIEASSVLEEKQGDLTPSHVCGGSETRLPVATTPVPGGIDEPRLLCEKRTDGVDVTVGAGDEGPDLVWI